MYSGARRRADDPAVDRDDRLVRIDLHPELGGLAVDGHPSVGDEHLARPPRRDARRGEDLLEPLERHQAWPVGLDPAGAASGRGRRLVPGRRKSGSMSGSPPSSARRAATSTVERRQLVEARQPEPLEELEAGAVQERPSRRARSTELDDEPPMQQRPDRVVGVDAADPLDRRLRHRLAVGHDRQRLERRGRQADRLGPDVSRDQGAAIGRGRELDPVAIDQQPDAAVTQRHLEVAEPGVDGRPVRAGERRDLAARQRLLGHEQQGLERGLGQLDRGRRRGRTVGRRDVLGQRVGLATRAAAAIDSTGSLTRTTPAIRRSARRPRPRRRRRQPVLRAS